MISMLFVFNGCKLPVPSILSVSNVQILSPNGTKFEACTLRCMLVHQIYYYRLK